MPVEISVSGDYRTCEIDEDIVVVTPMDMEVSHVQVYRSGTVQVTVKRRAGEEVLPNSPL